jgi:uncharacterized repeat protein (TIGR03803 family)
MKKFCSYLITLVFLFCLSTSNSNAQNPTQLWGMTSGGGQYNSGIIFKTDGSGNNETVQQSFFSISGANPNADLFQATDGKFYGMTQAGGTHGLGVLFQYDPVSSVYTNKINFAGLSNGSTPKGSLIQGLDGKLYGMTQGGGANGLGVLFQYDLSTNTLTDKLDFAGDADGAYPNGSLMQATDGKLYGMTYSGGTNNKGILFQFDPSTSILIKKFDFDGTATGSYPLGSLIQASDGKIYGMTTSGGVSNSGVLFQYDPTDSAYTKKFDFGGTDGIYPYGSLVQALDGKLYGMTYSGGDNFIGFGALFQFDPVTSVYTKKFDFAGTSTGYRPSGSLILALDGKLYGITSAGGANNSLGVLFQYDPSTSTYAEKFNIAGTTLNSGWNSLVQSKDGKLYGLTSSGGAGDAGILYQFDLVSSTYDKKLDFGYSIGESSSGSLVHASDGKFYGMTYMGGANGIGVIFQFDPTTSTLTKKVDFDNAITGGYTDGSLMQATDGMLYGMTDGGGVNGLGVLFQFDPATSVFTKKIDFVDSTGSSPDGSLIQATDGKLYGLTTYGGANGMGVLFQYDPTTSTYTKMFDFNGTTFGKTPYNSLIQASDGKLYGMTYEGGVNNLGVLFQYDFSTGILLNKLDFAGATNGSKPWGSLMQASDGKLYGMTNLGGANNLGVLFQYDPTTTIYVKKLDFAGATNGSKPYGSLMQASDGKIYGMTGSGGTNDKGVLFQYDPSTSTYVKKLDFNGANGWYPWFSVLVEVPVTINTSSVSTTICAGSAIDVPYTIAGAYDTGNVFTAQLSNASGSFASPVNIGTSTSSLAGSVSAIIPSSTAQGSGYKVRVVSSNPVITGADKDSSITINSKPPTPAINQNVNVLHSDASTGNQWYNPNGSIDGATNQDYTILASDAYHVLVTLNGCASEPSNTINAVITGVEITGNDKSIKVYPNPVSNELTIAIEGAKGTTGFEIYSSTGQIVFKGSLVEKTVVQTSIFSPGIYLIKLESGTTIQLRMIVKE